MVTLQLMNDHDCRKIDKPTIKCARTCHSLPKILEIVFSYQTEMVLFLSNVLTL